LTRGPARRFVIPTVVIVILLVLAAVNGAVLVPRLGSRPLALPSPTTPAAASSTAEVPDGAVPPPATQSVPPTPPASGAPAGRRADALAAWAAPIAAKLTIPSVALQAYGYAELVVSGSQPACQLRWTTLAGIGKIESNHGQANTTLGADGRSVPPIVGPPLDGQGGRGQVPDSDLGALDGDTVWDRAVGPMQFIPRTWKTFAVDADGDGIANPNDIDDAALAAANYLCSGGRTLSTADDWWNAILQYNDVQVYAQRVYEAANDYGLRSR
jgi:membrane-bound lytic murein transglycosylase B